MSETKTHPKSRRAGNVTLEFQDIEREGVYVTQRGDMFRIPPEALADGHSPLFQWESEEASLLTRVSSDPYTPISKCRQLAADCDLPVRF